MNRTPLEKYSILVVLATGVSCSSGADPVPEPVSRGRYLAIATGCNDCHTPWREGPRGPEPDLTRFLSGHSEKDKVLPAQPPSGQSTRTATMTAFAGPWGICFAANLTPDVNTGMGIWTEDMFFRAMREGKHMGQSRRIAPAMPWQAISTLHDEDLRAIWLFLRSIPAITNHVPDYQPPPDPDDK
jgi:hypothetical protein